MESTWDNYIDQYLFYLQVQVIFIGYNLQVQYPWIAAVKKSVFSG